MGTEGGQSMASESHTDRLPTADAERYDVGDVVASGGMGAILNARDLAIRRQVAMKVIKKGADRNASENPAAAFVSAACGTATGPPLLPGTLPAL